MSFAYYNEIDPDAASWLRELIEADLIAKGVVDERSIEDVTPNDLRGFNQCHFFAGIGVWSYALRKAGWPDEREVWTGSCPCQPFSKAGKKEGLKDARHLWPAFFRLIEKRKPKQVFGEQVASKDGLAWFDLVSSDLEGAGYTVGAADTCAAGFGSPHIRQRLWFVASGLGNSGSNGDREHLGKLHSNEKEYEKRPKNRYHSPEHSSAIGQLGNTNKPGLARRRGERGLSKALQEEPNRRASPTGGFWEAAEWVPCIDKRIRPIEPGSFPLAHGAPARVGRLRGYGNAIVAPVAQAFIESFQEIEKENKI